MPIYEYQCQKCGHHLEKRQSINDKPLTRCPICKGKLEKQWSQTSFQLKGSGWYVTDYAGKKEEKKSESTEIKASVKDEKSSSADASDAAKSESKPEAKSGDAPKSTGSEAKPKGKKSSTKAAD
jgi:putative FmdB family regulatory protein